MARQRCCSCALVVIVGLVSLAVFNSTAYAQPTTTVLRVDSASTASGGGTGASWPLAYTYLQDALDRAVELEPDGENLIVQIWVAAVPS